MKLSKFETCIFSSVMGGWILLLFGKDSWAFYNLGTMILLVLLGIMEYVRTK